MNNNYLRVLMDFGIIRKSNEKKLNINNVEKYEKFVEKLIHYNFFIKEENIIDIVYIDEKDLVKYEEILKSKKIDGQILFNNPFKELDALDYLKIIYQYYKTYIENDVSTLDEDLFKNSKKSLIINSKNKNFLTIKNDEEIIKDVLFPNLFKNQTPYSEKQKELLFYYISVLEDIDIVKKYFFESEIKENNYIQFFSFLFNKDVKLNKKDIFKIFYEKIKIDNNIKQYIKFAYDVFYYYRFIDRFVDENEITYNESVRKFLDDLNKSPNFNIPSYKKILDCRIKNKEENELCDILIFMFLKIMNKYKSKENYIFNLEVLSKRKEIVSVFDRINLDFKNRKHQELHNFLKIFRDKKTYKEEKNKLENIGFYQIMTLVKNKDIKAFIKYINYSKNYSLFFVHLISFLKREENIDEIEKQLNEFINKKYQLNLKHILKVYNFINFVVDIKNKRNEKYRYFNIRNSYHIKKYEDDFKNISYESLTKIYFLLEELILNHKNIKELKKMFENGYKFKNKIIKDLALTYNSRNLLNSNVGVISPGSIIDIPKNKKDIFTYIAWDNSTNDKSLFETYDVDLDLSTFFKIKNEKYLLNWQSFLKIENDKFFKDNVKFNVFHTGDITFCFNRNESKKVLEGIFFENRNELDYALLSTQSYNLSENDNVLSYIGFSFITLDKVKEKFSKQNDDNSKRIEIKNSYFYFEVSPKMYENRYIGIIKDDDFIVLNFRKRNMYVANKNFDDLIYFYFYNYIRYSGSIKKLFDLIGIEKNEKNGKEVDLTEVLNILFKDN